MKRKILIDLRFLRNLYYGFGQLSLYYGEYLKDHANKIADLDITVLVPKKFVGKFGNHIKYIETKPIYKLFPFLITHFDVWHSITQTPRYFSIDPSCSKIMTIHDLNFLYELSPEKAQKRLKRLQENIKKCDQLTAISYFTLDEVEKKIKTSNIPIHVNYVGLRDISIDLAYKPHFITNNTSKFFFTIGQVSEKKNFHVLIDLMELMPEYNLYICGQDGGEYAQMIKNKILEKKLKNVSVTGPISSEEKVWMYQNCYGFLFPSKFEGFGIPVIDAMRFGKPVFSSQMTSLKEIGSDYSFFWDNFDPHYMKSIIDNNIENFYNDQNFIEKEKKYAQSFSIEKHFDTYIEIYKNIPLHKGNMISFVKNYVSHLRY